MNERMKLVNKNIFFDGFTEHLKLAYGLKIRQMAYKFSTQHKI